MKGIIYKFENNINGKIYIGLTIHPKLRYTAHKNGYDADKIPLDAAIRKYGIDNFTYTIVEEVEEETLTELSKRLNILEEKYIKEYKSGGILGYNIRSGGESHIGENAPNYGKHFSNEWKQHLSESMKGKRNLPKDFKWSEEQKAKIKGRTSPFKNKHHTEESKEKLRQSKIGKLNSGPSKIVLQYSLDNKFIKEYPSAAEAARQFGENIGKQIRDCCKNRLKTCRGYVWKFKN